MNLYFGLICSADVLFNSSVLGFDFFAFAQCLTKKLEEKTIDSYPSYIRLFGFYTQRNVNSAGLPRVVLVLRWVLFVPEIFVSPHSEFEQHMYSSDPRPDSGSSMQLSHRLQSPHSKPQPGNFNNSTTRRPRSKKPLQTSGSSTFLSRFCFSITSQEAVSRSAALLLLPIKALALQKRPLFVIFEMAERTAAILDVAILCTVEGAQCKTRELP